MVRRAAICFLAWATSGLGAPAAGEPADKYGGTPFGRALERDLPALARRARARAEARTGVAPPDVAPLARDAESLSPEVLKKWKRAAAAVERTAEGPAVVLYREPVAAGEADPEAALAGAFVQAAFLARFSDKDLKAIPPWVVEGLALYAAGDEAGEATAERILLSRRKPPETLIDDLEGKHTASDLAQDFWTFLYLEKAFGRKAVRAFGRAVWEGRSYDAALMEVAGRGWGEIVSGAASFARAELAPLVSGTEAFKALADAVAELPPEERWRRAGEMEALLARHKRAYWRDKARYLVARWLEAGRRPEAAAAFRAIAESPPPRSPYAADARYRLAEILFDRRRWDEAEALYEACLRDHFDEPFAPKCLAALAEIADRRRDPAARRRRLEMLLVKYPDHAEADKARETLRRMPEGENKEK